MGITEVVRGADLVLSTFRQLLLLDALGRRRRPIITAIWCATRGERLAKRHDALSLRALRAQGLSPADVVCSLRSSSP